MPLEVYLDAEKLGITDINDQDQILAANYTGVVKNSVYELFQVSSRKEKRSARKLIAIDATGYKIQAMMKTNGAALLNTSITIDALVDDKVDFYLKALG